MIKKTVGQQTGHGEKKAASGNIEPGIEEALSLPQKTGAGAETLNYARAGHAHGR
jgi:hypothetical protein